MYVKLRCQEAGERRENKMPITAKQFEKGTLVENSKCRDLMLDFFLKNSPKAYKSSELVNEVKKSDSMVRTMLRRLFKEKKIEKKIIEVTKGHMTPFYRAVQTNKNARTNPARKKRR